MQINNRQADRQTDIVYVQNDVNNNDRRTDRQTDGRTDGRTEQGAHTEPYYMRASRDSIL